MYTNLRNLAKTFGKAALILSGIILANLLLSAGHEVLNNGDILDMCNTLSGAYGDNLMFCESVGLPEQDVNIISAQLRPILCPTCIGRKIEQWVVPDTLCPRCGTWV